MHYQVHQLPNQVVSVVKKLVTLKNNEMLIKLANAISWSQNENDAANTQLLPMIIQGAGHGTMTVKVKVFQGNFETKTRFFSKLLKPVWWCAPELGTTSTVSIPLLPL